ncbi:MAG: hypothetical protein ACLPXZ_00545 [Mycobacterium sp.]
MVNVAEFGGVVAAGESAGQIPAADEAGQLSRRAVSGLGEGVGKRCDAADGGARGGELGQLRGGHGATAHNLAGGQPDGRWFRVGGQRLVQRHLRRDGSSFALTGGVPVRLGT